jgi:LAO/AO transport system kinase
MIKLLFIAFSIPGLVGGENTRFCRHKTAAYLCTTMVVQLLANVQQGDFRALARAISYIENGVHDFADQLAANTPGNIPVIGVTGPPGAGKSTLVDALIGHYVQQQKRVAVLCVDPSSSLYHGALLGDRIRMGDWYNHPAVFIRSLATRGSLGGLHPRIIEITDLLRLAPFDQILIETVGVGQNEIEIAGLADTTLVVLAPEAGDDIQSMKAGLLEVADIFVVNKSDRPDADLFVRNLRSMQTPAFRREGRDIPVIKTIASQKQGIGELAILIGQAHKKELSSGKRYRLLAEQAYLLIQYQRMKDVDRQELAAAIEALAKAGNFNLYRFVKDHTT